MRLAACAVWFRFSLSRAVLPPSRTRLNSRPRTMRNASVTARRRSRPPEWRWELVRQCNSRREIIGRGPGQALGGPSAGKGIKSGLISASGSLRSAAWRGTRGRRAASTGVCPIKSYSDQSVTGFFAKISIVGHYNERNGGLIHACLTGYRHCHHSNGWARRLFRPSREGRGDHAAQVA